MKTLAGGKKDSSAMVPCVLTGLASSLAVSLILAFLIGSVLYFTSLSEAYLSTLSSIAILLSVFWGGSASAKRAGTRGLLHGLSVGLAYLVLVLIFSMAFFSVRLTFDSLAVKAFLSLVAGGLGGIYGVSRS